jgi:hypothetical protein
MNARQREGEAPGTETDHACMDPSGPGSLAAAQRIAGAKASMWLTRSGDECLLIWEIQRRLAHGAREKTLQYGHSRPRRSQP